jgi:hypothetical protein
LCSHKRTPRSPAPVARARASTSAAARPTTFL